MAEDAPGVAAWKERTSAFDRVRSVAESVSEPRSAMWIAEEAAVAENTARDHLERLVEMNVLLKQVGDGATTYVPDPLHTRARTLRELLNEHDHDGLLRVKAELQRRIEAWREEYGVETPAELRERAADTEEAAVTREIRTTANEWELVAYRLDIVEDAIENYGTYTRGSAVSA